MTMPTDSLFSLAPRPWKLYPELSRNDPAFIRDANGRTVARDLPNEVAEALVAFVNGFEGGGNDD